MKMELESGRILAHYRVSAKLGSGGMGDVYRATDSRLGREVAIKVLPDAFSGDAGRLARFEREARVLASLNHPHIAQIYGVEEHEGQRFLVLELIEGETLADRIGKGPLQVESILHVALQMSDALAAAHDRGIIHRDLKPANIMITDEGQVKVLDFGIAMTILPSTDSDHTPTITLTSRPTRAETLVGTPAYMSPEQARGLEADRRSDIWAFGVVLWEMLTGCRPFKGETDTGTLLNVMEEDPDWRALPPETPVPIRRLLRRCLQRDPRKRIHDFADARLEIEDVLSRPDHTFVDEPQPIPRASSSAPRRTTTATFLIGSALTALAVYMLIGNHPVPPDQPVRVSIPLPPGVQIDTHSLLPSLAISPDGRTVVFAGRHDETSQLYVRSVAQFNAVRIPGTDGGAHPFFSPDGTWVGFFTDEGLKKVALNGGSPQVLAEAPNPFGASWGPLGKIVISPLDRTGLLEVSEMGGGSRILIKPDISLGEWDLNWPDFLPDGRSLLFTSFQGVTAEDARVEILNLESLARTALIENASYARYVPTGHLIFGSGGGVQAVPFDAERRSIAGPAVPVPEPIYYDFELGVPHLSLSTDGTLAFVPGTSSPQRRLVLVDMEGVESPLIEAGRGYMYPQFSPDGRRLAVTVSEPGDTNIWVVELATGAQTKITLEGTNVFPSWTPDGRGITYCSRRGGQSVVAWSRADGGGVIEALVVPDDRSLWTGDSSWSPDGETLVYTLIPSNKGDPKGDILMAPGEGRGDSRPLVATGAAEFGAVISPDGHWMAYVSNDSGKQEVYVQPFPEGGNRHQISTDGGRQPMWAPDGGTIYFRHEDRILAVSVSTAPRFRAEAPRVLFTGDYEDGLYYNFPNFDLSPDGTHFVMIKPDTEWVTATEIDVVFNWFDELRTLAPARGPR